jgi:hypothetical protein
MGNCWSFVYEQTKSIFILRKPENRYVKDTCVQNANKAVVKNTTVNNAVAKNTIVKNEEAVSQETRIEIGSERALNGLRKGTELEEPYIRMRNDGNKDLPKLHSDIIIQVESDLGDEFVYVDA